MSKYIDEMSVLIEKFWFYLIVSFPAIPFTDFNHKLVKKLCFLFQLTKLKPTVKKTVSFHNIIIKNDNTVVEASRESISSPDSPVEIRRKTLRERRMSKSLCLKLSLSQELPIIRQNSVPKFFLDSPDEHNIESTLVKNPLTSLQSAKVGAQGFAFNLKSVVAQMETERQMQDKEMPAVHRAASKISLKDRMKLRKSKSTVSASNVPHINYI